MKIINPVTFLVFWAVILSCSHPKSTLKSTEQSTETKIVDEDMIKKGFVMGVIHTASSNRQCPIHIETKETPYPLDPINLEDAYMIDGLKIWFKYSPLRMMNRCEEANPIEIIEIQRRK